MNNGGKIQSFTSLNAWKNSHILVVNIYRFTKNFPKDELFGLTNQIRRAAVSITSNIAEGFSRRSYKEKIQFYSISLGSLTELQNQLIIARDVGYLKNDVFQNVGKETVVIHKLINGLIKSSKSRSHYS